MITALSTRLPFTDASTCRHLKPDLAAATERPFPLLFAVHDVTEQMVKDHRL
jgi:hypothetical protein